MQIGINLNLIVTSSLFVHRQYKLLGAMIFGRMALTRNRHNTLCNALQNVFSSVWYSTKGYQNATEQNGAQQNDSHQNASQFIQFNRQQNALQKNCSVENDND